jgi:hypothetical protein
MKITKVQNIRKDPLDAYCVPAITDGIWLRFHHKKDKFLTPSQTAIQGA